MSSVEQILLSPVSSNHAQCASGETKGQHRHEEEGYHEGFEVVGVALGDVERRALEPEVGFLLSERALVALLYYGAALHPTHEVEGIEEVGHGGREDIEQHDPPGIIGEPLL